MKKPPRDPDVADVAPTDPVLTVYDEEHIITYLRMLDADAEGADWREVAQIVLHINPDIEHDRAKRAFDTHLTRAKWMTEHGYRHLLRGGASNPNLQRGSQNNFSHLPKTTFTASRDASFGTSCNRCSP